MEYDTTKADRLGEEKPGLSAFLFCKDLLTKVK